MRSRGSVSGYGYIPDLDGHMVTPVKRLLGAEASVPVPNSASLRDHVSMILDQGSTGSCTGNATDGAVETRLAALGTPVQHRSPIGIYTLGRCIDRDGLLSQGLQDVGAMPNQVIRGISEWGLPIFGSMPADTKYGEAPDYNQVNAEPGLAALESADDAEFLGAYSIGTVNRTSLIRQALAAGYPVCFATMVDNAFENWNGQKPIGAPNPNDILGGHYLYMIGYDTTTDGNTIVEFANSWGVTWGLQGFGLGDESFIAMMSDLYVMNVRKASK